MHFIDNFDVILLDMGNTFMFDCDHFSDTDDFGITYRQQSGTRLTNEQVQCIISEVHKRMLADYDNPDCYDQFPDIRHYFKSNSKTKWLPGGEIDLLEKVFALHEIGRIPDPYSKTIHQLHKTHRLGLVSNIWSKSKLYLEEFTRAGVHDLFEYIVFSSDCGIIKPSPKIFTKAIAHFKVDRAKIVFIGDDLKRDIGGAMQVGLATVWINPGVSKIGTIIPNPDFIIQDLRELIDA